MIRKRRTGRDTCCHTCRHKRRCGESPTRGQAVCPFVPGDDSCQAAQKGRRPFCSVCWGYSHRKPPDPRNEPELPFGTGS